MADKIIEIDSLNVRPHTRHRAIVNRVRKPYEDNRILDSSIAMTLCGRAIGWFTETIGTSLTFADGTVYAVKCKGCYELPPHHNSEVDSETDTRNEGEPSER